PLKAAGIQIFAPIDGGSAGNYSSAAMKTPEAKRLQSQADYYRAARLQSDKDFLVMPNTEVFTMQEDFGGHNDLLISHPVYWTNGRAPGQPFEERDPQFGKVYHVGSPFDLLEMAHREDMIIYMPHPRSKGSTGYPDGMKDTPRFRDAAFRGVGFRWGMGLDGSEQRLCEYRCMSVFDDMNN